MKWEHLQRLIKQRTSFLKTCAKRLELDLTWQGSGVTLNAASVVVNAGGSINADGQGYVANAGPGGSPVGSR